MDAAFRTSWVIFAVALSAAVLGYVGWGGADVPALDAFTGEAQTRSAAMAFFIIPAFHFFSLIVAHAAVRARPTLRVTQFRTVAVVGVAFGMGTAHVLMIAHAYGLAINMMASVGTIAGLLMVVCGNYLPKCARDDSVGLAWPWNILFSVPWSLPLAYLFGIRTWWTLSSDHAWNRTHRLAGRLWIVGGMIYAGAGWFTSPVTYFNLLGFAWTIMTIVPIVHSFIAWHGTRRGAAA